jgi:hypothetical protein
MGGRLGTVAALSLVALSACGKSGSRAPDGGSDAGTGGAAGSRDAGGDGAAGNADAGGAGAAGGGAGAAGDADANVCPRNAPSFDFFTSTLGPRGGSYDGPAVVERSTPAELVLAFYAADATPDGGAGADGGAASTDGGAAGERGLPLHATIQGLYLGTAVAPTLPLGAQVWLTKNPAGDPPPSMFNQARAPGAFTVRDGSQGTILLAGSFDAPTPIPTSPGSRSCTETHGQVACVVQQTTYGSLDVHGDTTVLVGDGETATVSLRGVAYDVSVVSESTTSTLIGMTCGGGNVPPPYGAVSVNLKAQDLATRAAKLAAAKAPACSKGNVDVPAVTFSFIGGNAALPYEGAASYTAKDDTGCLRFAASARLDPQTNAPATIEVCGATGLIAEPTAGATFWFSMPALDVSGIRTGQAGPLVLASISTSAGGGFPSAAVDQVVGVHVDLNRACAYGSTVATPGAPPLPTSFLAELVFATAPPVIVTTDTQAVVTLGGTPYDVRMTGEETTNGLSSAFVISPH